MPRWKATKRQPILENPKKFALGREKEKKCAFQILFFGGAPRSDHRALMGDSWVWDFSWGRGEVELPKLSQFQYNNPA